MINLDYFDYCPICNGSLEKDFEPPSCSQCSGRDVFPAYCQKCDVNIDSAGNNTLFVKYKNFNFEINQDKNYNNQSFSLYFYINNENKLTFISEHFYKDFFDFEKNENLFSMLDKIINNIEFI